MRVADNPFDPGQRCQFLRSTLRITPRDQDPRGGVLPMYAANGLTDIVIGGRSHRAGIEHDQVCSASFGSRFESSVRQQVFECGAVSLCSTASEILNEV